MASSPVVVVGAGVAGISCARYLQKAGIPVIMLEASNRVGGRIVSDTVDGFTLDRGFQVLLTAYPEVRRLLEYRDFPIRSFFPGALIWTGERFELVADPFRRPLMALQSIMGGYGSLRDKWLVLQLRFEAMRGSLADIWSRPELSTREFLEQFGFSKKFVQAFFEPFLGGVFFDRKLLTSSRMLLFVYRMFAAGVAALPAQGMGALPEKLASSLPREAIRLGETVQSVEEDRVTLQQGSTLSARRVVVAVDGDQAKTWGNANASEWRATTCIYFSASQPPQRGPYLILNGSGNGRVSNVVVLTEVAPEYSRDGKSLIVVSIPELLSGDDNEVEIAVRQELLAWFGTQVNSWSMIRVYRIPKALPVQQAVPLGEGVREQNGIVFCGDYLSSGSLNGALVSGRAAAELVIRQLTVDG